MTEIILVLGFGFLILVISSGLTIVVQALREIARALAEMEVSDD